MKSFKVDAKLTEIANVSLYIEAETEAEAIEVIKQSKFDTQYKRDKIRYQDSRKLVLENLGIDHDHTEELDSCFFCDVKAYKRLFPEEYKGQPVCPSCIWQKNRAIKESKP